MASKKNGLIQELGPHGEVMKETEYAEGKKHGTQTCYDPDGNPVKITTYENNVRVYEETYYKGQIVSKTSYFNGKKEGKCELYENGIKVSEANYANGKKDGIELTYHANGQVATKFQYQNGKRNWKAREEYHPNGQPSKIVTTVDGVITDTEYKMDNGVPTAQYISREDGIFIQSNHFYLNGKIGRIERANAEKYSFFDPDGNKITSEEFYATELSNYVGWGNWNSPSITEEEFLERRRKAADEREATRRQEIRNYGVAWTKPLKITPVKAKPCVVTQEPAVQLALPEPEVVRKVEPVEQPVHVVQYHPETPKLGFWGKLLEKLA